MHRSRLATQRQWYIRDWTRFSLSVATIIFLVSILFSFIIMSNLSFEKESSPTTTTTYTIKSGDSLWSIAENLNEEYYNNSMDTRELIIKIKKVNGISDNIINENDVILLPIR